MRSSLKKLPTVDQLVVKAEKDKKKRSREEKEKKIGTKEDGGRAEESGEGAKGRRSLRRFHSCLTSMETNERNNLQDGDNRQQNLPDQRKIECFGDLNVLQASYITNKLGQTVKELLWTELEQELRHSEKLLIEMMLQSKSYPIRNYTNSLEVDERERVITLFRKVLSTHRGVIGPLLSPDMLIKEIEFGKVKKLIDELCVDDRWKPLAERLSEDHDTFEFDEHEKRQQTVFRVLKWWGLEKNGTVGELYDILVDLDLANLANYL